MKLRMENNTHYSTRALRGIISAVAKLVAKEEQRNLASLLVRVGYARTWGQAHGALGYGRMWLFYRKGDPPSVGRVASDVRHELMHNYGYHHSKRGANSPGADGWFYDRPLPETLIAELVAKWGPQLSVKVIPKRAPAEVVALRYARVLELEKIWKRKAKLAATKLRALRQRHRYYEQRMEDRIQLAAMQR